MNYKRLKNKYAYYISKLKSRSPKNFSPFLDWLVKYIHYKTSEHTFKPTFLPKYDEGQIIFIDFGCGISHEFSYPHYAIVLNGQDRKKNSLLTVLPLTSKKEFHDRLRPFEYELAIPISDLLMIKTINSFDLNRPEYAELRKDAINLTQQELCNEEFTQKYNDLIQQGVQAIAENNPAIMNLREKMNRGSIVECNQIRTISKARILAPKKASHPLYNIKIATEDLNRIRVKLMQLFILTNIDNYQEKSIK